MAENQETTVPEAAGDNGEPSSGRQPAAGDLPSEEDVQGQEPVVPAQQGRLEGDDEPPSREDERGQEGGDGNEGDGDSDHGESEEDAIAEDLQLQQQIAAAQEMRRASRQGLKEVKREKRRRDRWLRHEQVLEQLRQETAAMQEETARIRGSTPPPRSPGARSPQSTSPRAGQGSQRWAADLSTATDGGVVPARGGAGAWPNSTGSQPRGPGGSGQGGDIAAPGRTPIGGLSGGGDGGLGQLGLMGTMTNQGGLPSSMGPHSEGGGAPWTGQRPGLSPVPFSLPMADGQAGAGQNPERQGWRATPDSEIGFNQQLKDVEQLEFGASACTTAAFLRRCEEGFVKDGNYRDCYRAVFRRAHSGQPIRRVFKGTPAGGYIPFEAWRRDVGKALVEAHGKSYLQLAQTAASFAMAEKEGLDDYFKRAAAQWPGMEFMQMVNGVGVTEEPFAQAWFAGLHKEYKTNVSIDSLTTLTTACRAVETSRRLAYSAGSSEVAKAEARAGRAEELEAKLRDRLQDLQRELEQLRASDRQPGGNKRQRTAGGNWRNPGLSGTGQGGSRAPHMPYIAPAAPGGFMQRAAMFAPPVNAVTPVAGTGPPQQPAGAMPVNVTQGMMPPPGPPTGAPPQGLACWVCGQPGHFVRECPVHKAKGGCQSCGKLTHSDGFCLKPHGAQGRPQGS